MTGSTSLLVRSEDESVDGGNKGGSVGCHVSGTIITVLLILLGFVDLTFFLINGLSADNLEVVVERALGCDGHIGALLASEEQIVVKSAVGIRKVDSFLAKDKTVIVKGAHFWETGASGGVSRVAVNETVLIDSAALGHVNDLIFFGALLFFLDNFFLIVFLIDNFFVDNFLVILGSDFLVTLSSDNGNVFVTLESSDFVAFDRCFLLGGYVLLSSGVLLVGGVHVIMVVTLMVVVLMIVMGADGDANHKVIIVERASFR